MVRASALPTVHSDPGQLVQLFQNLVANALKFRRGEPPRVTIDCVRADGAWRFSVEDNGIGIEPEYRERVFAIFQRLHGRDTHPGTGIGLAICHRIVERHGGRIWIESADGPGVRFVFTFPAFDGGEEGG